MDLVGRYLVRSFSPRVQLTCLWLNIFIHVSASKLVSVTISRFGTPVTIYSILFYELVLSVLFVVWLCAVIFVLPLRHGGIPLEESLMLSNTVLVPIKSTIILFVIVSQRFIEDTFRVLMVHLICFVINTLVLSEYLCLYLA